MSTTRYKPRSPGQTTRLTEAAELQLWRQSTAGDNRDQMERLRRNLRLVWGMELTQRQAQVLEMHFDRQLTVTQIARELGLSPSTVSRTLRRGRERIEEYLRYSF